MQLFHTSPGEIENIDMSGRFGEFLFFSSRKYTMTPGSYVTYQIDVSDDTLIEASRLFYHAEADKLTPLVAEFCERFDVDEDTAEEIISERQQLDDVDADDSWECQYFTARAAKVLGYRGVIVTDEQGTSVMIDMLGRKSDLQILENKRR